VHIPKEQATVGALRARARADGVDTALRSMRTRPQTMGDSVSSQQELYMPTRS